MSQFATSSGLSGLFTDAVEFLAAISFAQPEALWLLLVLPVLGLLNFFAARKRRLAIAAIGRPVAVAGQLTRSSHRYRWLGLMYPLAWLLLIIGIAGPRWGKSDETGVAIGRDLMIVIDLSRSMQADDMNDAEAPTRWEAARKSALDLVEALERRGGHRIGIIVFAARPVQLCHLTTDYEHARAVLEDLDGEYPPPEIRPGADHRITSGTRIGSALILAVNSRDERYPEAQDIILISDGDDPGDDKEYVRGSDAARTVKIPVHTVGLGDPKEPAVIVVGMEHPELVSTLLVEEPLKQIAAETRGRYLPAQRQVPALGEFFRDWIEQKPSREYTGNALPQPRVRYAWFLVPALVLFCFAWFRGK